MKWPDVSAKFQMRQRYITLNKQYEACKRNLTAGARGSSTLSSDLHEGDSSFVNEEDLYCNAKGSLPPGLYDSSEGRHTAKHEVNINDVVRRLTNWLAFYYQKENALTN